MALKLSPYRFLRTLGGGPAGQQSIQMATVIAPSPLVIQFDGEDDYYSDALSGVNRLCTGQRVVATRIAGRWVITNIVTGRLDGPPLFATVAERTAAFPNPVVGDICSVTATGETYRYSGSAWLGLTDRLFYAASNQSVTDSTTVVACSALAIPLEANSKYIFHGRIFYFSSGTSDNDMKFTMDTPTSVNEMSWNAFGSTNTINSEVNTLIWCGHRAPGLTIGFETTSTVTFSLGLGGHAITTSECTIGPYFAEQTAVTGVTSVTISHGSFIYVRKVG